MSLQTNVIILVVECLYIFVFDAVSFFYQWLIRIFDRHKLTIMSHRKQKQFNMTVMKFKNNSTYVQKKIDIILRIYKAFVKTYVNDIIIFSHTLKKHVSHLRQIFQLLNLYDIRLSLKKSYFDYSTVALLSQKMNAFDLIIAANKLAAIVNLKYSHTLKNLKIYLNFTEWLRNYIVWYAQKSESLQRRKTLLLRESSFNKSRQRKMYFVKIQLTTTTIVELESYR